jgi:hypothetical protein
MLRDAEPCFATLPKTSRRRVGNTRRLRLQRDIASAHCDVSAIFATFWGCNATPCGRTARPTILRDACPCIASAMGVTRHRIVRLRRLGILRDSVQVSTSTFTEAPSRPAIRGDGWPSFPERADRVTTVQRTRPQGGSCPAWGVNPRREPTEDPQAPQGGRSCRGEALPRCVGPPGLEGFWGLSPPGVDTPGGANSALRAGDSRSPACTGRIWSVLLGCAVNQIDLTFNLSQSHVTDLVISYHRPAVARSRYLPSLQAVAIPPDWSGHFLPASSTTAMDTSFRRRNPTCLLWSFPARVAWSPSAS